MSFSDVSSQRPLRLIRSPGFRAWLAEQDISLAISTYQAGRLLVVGRASKGLSLESRPFGRCMGLWADANGLWVASRYELIQLVATAAIEDLVRRRNADENDLPDRVYSPGQRFSTGNLDIHDVVCGPDGVVFVNTRFSCLAVPDADFQFRVIWKPPFVRRISPDDRCHLNGLAHRDGMPSIVTACCPFDEPRAWRQHRADGGCLVDVATSEMIAGGLSMPHSPRLRGDTLWMLESGTGFLGTVDRDRGVFCPHVFCPGYLRGLAFVGRYALIGSSLIRRPEALEGLALGDNLKRYDADAVCGVFVVDLEAGSLVHWLRIEGHIKELYDVVVLPAVRRPALTGSSARTGPDKIRYVWQDRVVSCRSKSKPNPNRG